MIISILLIPRHISPIHHVPRPARQPCRKHRGRIVEQVPLAGIAPVPRAVQRWRTPGSHRTQHHVHDPCVFATKRQHIHSIPIPRPRQPSPHRVPMPRILRPIRIPLARQLPHLRHAPRSSIRIVGQDEIAHRPHWLPRGLDRGFLFGAAVAEVQAADYLPASRVGVGGEGDGGDVWV